MIKKTLNLLVLLLCACLLFSCSNGSSSSGVETSVDYTIYFETNGGDPIEPMNIKAGTDVLSIQIPDPVKTDCEFLYWADEYGYKLSTEIFGGNSSSTNYFSILEYNQDPEIYFYAVWKSTNPSLIFSAGDGYFEMSDGSKKEKITYLYSDLKLLYETNVDVMSFVTSKETELQALAKKENYKFSNWKYTTTLPYDHLSEGEDVVFAINWEAAAIAEFDSNGGSEIPKYFYKEEYLEITELYTNDHIPTKDDYVFAGWFTDKDCTKFYQITQNRKPVHLYAKWIPKEYTVTKENIKTVAENIKNEIGYKEIGIFYREEISEKYDDIMEFLDKQAVTIHYTGFISQTEINVLKELMGKEYDAKPENNAVFVNLDLSKAEGMTDIPPRAFSYCTGLYSVKISEKISNINDNAFKDCTYLKKVDLPASLSSIGKDVFSSCISIESITIPDGTKELSDNVFEACQNLKTVVLPVSLITIGEEAFKSCTSLQEITIPEYITTIKKGTFNNCKLLNKVTLPKDLSKIGDSAFESCESLEEFVLPNKVHEMGVSAFKNCKSLKELKLTAYLTELKASTFNGCTSLTKMDLYNVTVIWDSVFANCEALTNLTFRSNFNIVGDSAFFNCKSITEISLPDSVSAIGKSAFNGCTSLKKINIPENVERISYHCFDGCSALTDVTIDDNDSNLLILDDRAFADCISLKNITLPDSLQVIDTCAFYNCSALTDITIPWQVVRIGDSVFKGCPKLAEIKFDSNYSGWYKTTASNYSGGEKVEDTVLENKTNNVTIFRDSEYNKFWYRTYIASEETVKYICVYKPTGEEE